MTLGIKGYLLGGCQMGEGLEINGGIFPCGQTAQSSKQRRATVAFFLAFPCPFVFVCAHWWKTQTTNLQHINANCIKNTTCFLGRYQN